MLHKKYPFAKSILSLILLALSSMPLISHQKRIPMIVDTDMAHDDARAIILLSNLSGYKIRLMVTSDGAVSPKIGKRNLKKLLTMMGNRSIRIESGKSSFKKPPLWRKWSENFLFDKSEIKPSNIAANSTAVKEIVSELNQAKRDYIYLCLGPMSNLAEALNRNRGIVKRISRVIYYGTPPEVSDPDWNTQRDPEAVKSVLKSGIPIDMIRQPLKYRIPFKRSLLTRIENLKTPASITMSRLFHDRQVALLLEREHFMIWDELAVLYLKCRDLFETAPPASSVFSVKPGNEKKLIDTYIQLLTPQTERSGYR